MRRKHLSYTADAHLLTKYNERESPADSHHHFSCNWQKHNLAQTTKARDQTECNGLLFGFLCESLTYGRQHNRKRVSA